MASQELPGAMQKADTNVVLGLCISNLAANPNLREKEQMSWWLAETAGLFCPHFRAMEGALGRHYGPEPTSHVPITKVIKPQQHLVIWQITFPVIKCTTTTRSAIHRGEGGDLNSTPTENLLRTVQGWSLHLKTVHSTTRTVSAMETTA